MKQFHLFSFILGILSGILILFIFVGGKHLLWPSAQTDTITGQGTFQQGGNTSRMAQRLGMTEDELKKELASGKTFQEIAKEKGMDLPAGRGNRQTGSGAAFPGTSSGSGLSQRTSSVQSSAQ